MNTNDNHQEYFEEEHQLNGHKDRLLSNTVSRSVNCANKADGTVNICVREMVLKKYDVILRKIAALKNQAQSRHQKRDLAS
jgi:hypothetical protein